MITRSVLRKRKIDEVSDNMSINKKPNIDWSQMVSASCVRNYLLNDPILDYFNEYYRSNNNRNHTTVLLESNTPKGGPPKNTFFSKILEAGIEFEKELVEIIKKSHQVVKVAEYYQARDWNKYLETIELMKQGTDIIYQALLIDIDSKTYGLPDLLVKSTYLNKLMGYQVLTDEEQNIGSPNLNVNWHYVVIDIKHSNIPLRADGIHILNSDSIPCYKGQLLIYMNIVNKILGINRNRNVAYIWGKKYFHSKSGMKFINNNFLHKLGVLDYNNVDSEYINKTNNAINWIRQVRNDGSSWTLEPLPCREELYPNMKNSMDFPWTYEKDKLNNKIQDITSIWNCGVKNRKEAHKHNVFRWTDPRCNSKVLGLGDGKISKTVDKILEINRQNKLKLCPSKILYDRNNWLNESDFMEFYLDFETFNSNFGSIIKEGVITYDSNQMIFMIGCGFMKNKEWSFKTFYMKNKSNEAEEEMIIEWINWMNKKLVKYNKSKAKLYHWSHAEQSSLNNLWSRNPELKKQWCLNKFTFYDLYKVFVNEPVVIKGALDFSLKSIANSMFTLNLINNHWDKSNPCSNGLNAMTIAQEIYSNNKNDLINEPGFKDIIKYNEIDCLVMKDIHFYMRNNL